VDFSANVNIENQMSLNTQLPRECNAMTQRNPRVLECMAEHLASYTLVVGNNCWETHIPWCTSSLRAATVVVS